MSLKFQGCATDVFAGIALTYEPAESSILAEPPRDLRTSNLVDLKLIGYSYLFYGTVQSIGSFIIYFMYMNERGVHDVPSPIPLDDDGSRTFPAGSVPCEDLISCLQATPRRSYSVLGTGV